MEPSEDPRRVVDRWTKAISEGDAESALGRLSEHAGTPGDRNRPGRVVARPGGTRDLGAADRGAGLVAGSGIDFLESREAELKGLEGLHRLHAVGLA